MTLQNLKTWKNQICFAVSAMKDFMNIKERHDLGGLLLVDKTKERRSIARYTRHVLKNSYKKEVTSRELILDLNCLSIKYHVIIPELSSYKWGRALGKNKSLFKRSTHYSSRFRESNLTHWALRNNNR